MVFTRSGVSWSDYLSVKDAKRRGRKGQFGPGPQCEGHCKCVAMGPNISYTPDPQNTLGSPLIHCLDTVFEQCNLVCVDRALMMEVFVSSMCDYTFKYLSHMINYSMIVTLGTQT